MSEWFEHRRFLVSGGSGFLGTRIVAALEARGAAEVFVPRSAQYDLRTFEACEQALAAARPDVVIHAAGTVGGIGATASQPGAFFYENAAMGLNVVEACRHVGRAVSLDDRILRDRDHISSRAGGHRHAGKHSSG